MGNKLTGAVSEAAVVLLWLPEALVQPEPGFMTPWKRSFKLQIVSVMFGPSTLSMTAP